MQVSSNQNPVTRDMNHESSWLLIGILISWLINDLYMDVSQNNGKTPKWMVKIMVPTL